MPSKYFFEQFKDQIKEEHEKYEANQEIKEIPKDKCNHKGKVKFILNELRCACGAAWSGSGIKQLFDKFNKG